jgi:hypothetical protein
MLSSRFQRISKTKKFELLVLQKCSVFMQQQQLKLLQQKTNLKTQSEKMGV